MHWKVFMRTKKLYFTFSICCSCFLSLLFIDPLFATTYYVDSVGGDDSNTGLGASTAWATLQQANSGIANGDTVIVLDGTYNSDANGDGVIVEITKSNTTWKSVNRHGAVVNGGGIELDGITIKGANNVTIDGFEITAFKRSGIADHSIGSGHVIKNNLLHDIGRIVDVCNPGPCTSRSAILAQTTGSNWTIENNIIHDVGRLESPPSHPKAPTIHDHVHDHGIDNRTQNALIQNNVIYNIFSGWPVIAAAPSSGQTSGADGSTIINNTLSTSNTFKSSSRKRASAVLVRASDITVTNNILHIDPSLSSANLAFGAIDIYQFGGKETGLNFSNNLTNSTQLWGNHDDPPAWGTQTVAIELDNIVNTDPLFVDPLNADFHLQSTSLAIDAGIATNAPSVDFDGIARPQGAGYDIGAYESIGVPEPSTLGLAGLLVLILGTRARQRIPEESLATCSLPRKNTELLSRAAFLRV